MGFDPIHQGGAKVVYVDVTRNDLRRVEHPDVTHAGGPYEPCSLGFTPTVDLPDAEDRLPRGEPLRSPRRGFGALSCAHGLTPWFYG